MSNPLAKKAGKKPATELQIAPAEPSSTTALTKAQRAELELNLNAGVNRFLAIQGAIKASTTQLKALTFLAGIETSYIRDQHHDLHGETRGGDGTPCEVPLIPWVEERLGVTERVWRRYLNFYQVTAAAHPELARKIIACWDKWKSAKIKAPAKPKALKPGAKAPKAQLTTSPGAQLLAGAALSQADLDELLMAADEWGLHELFEVPIKDVTAPPPEPPPSNGNAVIKFWIDDFTKRALKAEYMKLPKPQREALLTTLEEMRNNLADSLKKKA